MKFGLLLSISIGSVALSGCGLVAGNKDEVTNEVPVMRWDHRPEAVEWTTSTLAALNSHGSPLLNMVPNDINAFCPGYVDGSPSDRAAFWSGLLSALAKHESTWRPEASGGGGAWIGLTQISPATARGYGCAAKSVSALKNGSANLSCAVRIIAQTVPRDGVITQGGRGVAADWAPFLNASKRKDMMEWTSAQSYCAK